MAEYWLDKEFSSEELLAQGAEVPKLSNENAIKVLLEQVEGNSEHYQKLLISRAINLGSLEAGVTLIKSAQWDAAVSVNVHTERFRSWKSSEAVVDGFPVPVIYAEIIANWATRTGALSREQKETYFKEAAEILKQHHQVHPIVANEYLWLWDKVNSGKNKQDPDYIALRDKTETELKAGLEDSKGLQRVGYLLTLCELYDNQRQYQKAKTHYEAAAEMGSAHAQYIAGLYYLNGRWERDQEKGKAYLDQAVLQGHEHAENEIRKRKLFNPKYHGESVTLSFSFRQDGDFKHYSYSLHAFNGEYTLNASSNEESHKVIIPENAYAKISNVVRPLVNGKKDKNGRANSAYVSLSNSSKNTDFSTFIDMTQMPPELLNLTGVFERYKKKAPVIPETISGEGEIMTYTCRWTFPAVFGPDGNVTRMVGEDADIIIFSQVTNSGELKKLRHEDNVKIYTAAKKIMALPDHNLRRSKNYFSLSFVPVDNHSKTQHYRCDLENAKAIPQEVIEFLTLAIEMGKKYGKR